MNNDKEILIRVCEWYYLDGLTQQQIAARLRTSRFVVMRLLKEAVNKGVITFSIAKPDDVNADLGRQLERELGLWQALVVNSGRNTKDTLLALGKGAANVLAQLLQRGDIVGVSSGTTVAAVVENLCLSQPPDNLTVVQLVGSLPEQEGRGDAYRISQDLATKLGAQVALLCAPAIVDRPDLRGALLMDSNIKPTIQQFSQIDVALVGIGSLTANDQSNWVRQGYLSIDEQNELQRKGVVGDILSHFITAEGKICGSSLDDRIIAMPAEVLRRVKYSIAVAGGNNKADAIKGAVRGGFVKILVTDDKTARKILNTEAVGY